MLKKLYNSTFEYFTLNIIYKFVALSYILYAASILIPCYVYIIKDKNVSIINIICIILCASLYLYFSTIAKIMRRKYDSIINSAVYYLLDSEDTYNIESAIEKSILYLYEHSDLSEIHYNTIAIKIVNEYTRRLK